MTAAIVVGITAFCVSLLTFFSGFGLGTLLMPVFALFFPIEVAVASTAVVHAANNLFKVGLLGRSAPRDVILRFGVPAVVASLVGALLLTALSTGQPLTSWSLFGHTAEVTPIKVVMGILILGFAVFELVPSLQSLRAPVRWLPLGGALSGFFGGLSGHQGALRAIFLAPLGLSPAQFVSTQAVIALFVDGARLIVYAGALWQVGGASGASAISWPSVVIATLGAFGGALLGRRLLKSVTVDALRIVVGVLLVVVGVALATGIA